MNRFLIIFIFLLSIVVGCKKTETSDSGPVITISSPTQNLYFNYGDTIKVRGKVTNERNIQSVKISIYNQNKDVEVVPSVNFTNLSKEFDINQNIVFTDPTISTGIYYVCVSAHDGLKINKIFIPINLVEMRKKLLGILCYTYNTQYFKTLSLLDTLNNIHSINTFEGDYETSEVSSQYRLIFSGGALTGDFMCYDLSYNRTNWHLSNLSNNISAWFRSTYFHNSIIYVSTNNGIINGYTIAGTPVKSYRLENNWVGVQMLNYENRFFAIVEKLGYNLPQIAQFYNSSSQFLNQQPLTFQPIKMFENEPGQLIIFGVENGISKSFLFYYEDNHINVHTVFGSTTIKDVVKISDTQYLILTTEGVLLYSSDLNVGISMLCSFTNGNSILFDSLNNQFFVISAFSISTYNFPSGSLKSTYNSPKQILKTHLYYNR